MQLAHLGASCVVQAFPVAASPFEHEHVLAWHVSSSLWKPVLQPMHLALPCSSQADPVAATPLLQVHALAAHVLLAVR